MKANLLKLNAEKTHVLTVGTKERLNVIPHKVEVVMDDILLKDSESGYENILGCQVSSDLKWHTHVKNLKTKLSQRLVALSKIQYSAPFKVKKSIAEGIFTSTLAYCYLFLVGLRSKVSGIYRCYRIGRLRLYAPLQQDLVEGCCLTGLSGYQSTN